MICPYIINISVLIGGILSWGIMWPLIGKKAGQWYPAGSENMHGLQGYKVTVTLSPNFAGCFKQTTGTNKVKMLLFCRCLSLLL